MDITLRIETTCKVDSIPCSRSPDRIRYVYFINGKCERILRSGKRNSFQK
jgi:hypothetical protein